MGSIKHCAVCGHPPDDHPFRHPFQGPDQDVVLEKPKKQQTQVVKAGPGEGLTFRLIHTLIKKGVLDGDDLAQLFGSELTGTHRPDRSAGPEEDAIGGSRARGGQSGDRASESVTDPEG